MRGERASKQAKRAFLENICRNRTSSDRAVTEADSFLNARVKFHVGVSFLIFLREYACYRRKARERAEKARAAASNPVRENG